ncbi:energy transducer TonB [Sphingomonas sp. S2-65]|uniref:energy transducer TonB n=1 Tax=Sphingomonas sp. S2-65 TaxID=2903960 RepID=UPI001F1AF0A0|nr:energy transducer TonB [Sphingomonas sp. S2-65]UYY57854.1 energy transducer TonB [Sphingomonas sp. S2-65]
MPNPTPIPATPPLAPLISPQAPAAAVPLPGLGTGGDGTADGRGRGSGDGAGDGDGSGADGGGGTRYARAEWIERPTRKDFEREWPPMYRKLDAPVRVILACYVKPTGRPYRCTVAAINRRNSGFGSAAIRLVQGARVRPVLRNGEMLDVPVLAPIVFLPVPEVLKAAKTRR